MPTLNNNKVALLDHLRATFAPTAADPLPPEFVVVEAAVAALPEGSYMVYDVELEGVPGWVYTLPHTRVAEWPGTAEGSFGWGDLQAVFTGHGQGFACNVGGSTMQSATGFYVLPAKLEQVVAE